MWIPKERDKLNVQLPGELIRASVNEVISDNAVIACLDMTAPAMRTHNYIRDQFVPVIRERDALGQEIWKAVDERTLQNVAEADRIVAEERERKRKEDEEKAEILKKGYVVGMHARR